MKTNKGCTYWYEVSMHVDKKGDGYHTPAKVRIPVRCDASGEYASRCTYLNPSSASVETQDILNERLFDDPYPFLNAVDKEERPEIKLPKLFPYDKMDRSDAIRYGEECYQFGFEAGLKQAEINSPSPSEHNKEDFYKYGASLGIKINDLQRLAMLLKPSETQEELWREILRDLDVWARTCKSSLDTSFLIETMKTKFKLIRK